MTSYAKIQFFRKICVGGGKFKISKSAVGFGGKIDNVNVIDGGSEYTTPPVLEVVGAGKLAKLKANIVDGKIDSVTVIAPGKIMFMVKLL